MSNLKDKVILITGAASGLGLAAAKDVASSGAKLSLVDYNEDGLKKAKDEIESTFPGTKVLTVTADVSNEEAVKNYLNLSVKEFGRIDGFYNNAGI